MTRWRSSHCRGLIPVSSRKRRVNVRTLIRACAAISSRLTGSASRSSAQARVVSVPAPAVAGTGRSMY